MGSISMTFVSRRGEMRRTYDTATRHILQSRGPCENGSRSRLMLSEGVINGSFQELEDIKKDVSLGERVHVLCLVIAVSGEKKKLSLKV